MMRPRASTSPCRVADQSREAVIHSGGACCAQADAPQAPRPPYTIPTAADSFDTPQTERGKRISRCGNQTSCLSDRRSYRRVDRSPWTFRRRRVETEPQTRPPVMRSSVRLSARRRPQPRTPTHRPAPPPDTPAPVRLRDGADDRQDPGRCPGSGRGRGGRAGRRPRLQRPAGTPGPLSWTEMRATPAAASGMRMTREAGGAHGRGRSRSGPGRPGAWVEVAGQQHRVQPPVDGEPGGGQAGSTAARRSPTTSARSTNSETRRSRCPLSARLTMRRSSTSRGQAVDLAKQAGQGALVRSRTRRRRRPAAGP